VKRVLKQQIKLTEIVKDIVMQMKNNIFNEVEVADEERPAIIEYIELVRKNLN
jgi:hypothetical protein